MLSAEFNVKQLYKYILKVPLNTRLCIDRWAIMLGTGLAGTAPCMTLRAALQHLLIQCCGDFLDYNHHEVDLRRWLKPVRGHQVKGDAGLPAEVGDSSGSSVSQSSFVPCYLIEPSIFNHTV